MVAFFALKFCYLKNYAYLCCVIKSISMENVLKNLAEKLVGLDNYVGDNIVLDEQEFEVDEKLIFITGKIAYTFNLSVGDYYTPSSTDREFYFADLTVKVYQDLDDENGTLLTNDQLEILYKYIKKYTC